MRILVNNAGSSSLKFQFIDMNSEKVLLKGICEKIGLSDSFIKFYVGKKEFKTFMLLKSHKDAFLAVKEILTNKKYGVIKNLNEVDAIGHRVVQGGKKFKNSVLINKEVISEIRKFIPLAPLHNSANLLGIEACFDVFGTKVPQVVVFDTSFHSTMPQKAYMYAIPFDLYKKYGIRKYGFHGTSHKYVSQECLKLLNKEGQKSKIITCHLGNGSSIAAIENGKVIDTSMGFTPLDGFMMGTRSGSIDPSVVGFIAKHENLSLDEVNELLNKRSGLLGISGVSSDCREIVKAQINGNSRALLASEMLVYQIVKFIGSYFAVLSGCDAIVFTAGVGENQALYREKICEALQCFGIILDKEKNNMAIGGKCSEISTSDSKIRVFVIPTNEELVIARETKDIVMNI